ncbi:MAG TPA: hypothetical protein DDW50_19520 [Firmicutes bacterium]|jgi:hypothetical protein|nr:hypothetical protein [Bacillota bacterium]
MAVEPQNNPEDVATDGSVNPIKNSNSGNRMAGAMKERPGTMGAWRLFGFFLAAQKETQPVKAVDRKKSAFIYSLRKKNIQLFFLHQVLSHLWFPQHYPF